MLLLINLLCHIGSSSEKKTSFISKHTTVLGRSHLFKNTEDMSLIFVEHGVMFQYKHFVSITFITNFSSYMLSLSLPVCISIPASCVRYFQMKRIKKENSQGLLRLWNNGAAPLYC